MQAKFGGAGGGIRSKNGRGVRAAVAAETAPSAIPRDAVKEGTKEYDAIVIGSGIGGLVAATQLAIRGARVILLEKYVIPGGSSGYFQREGYTFDVGSSVMFGFSDGDEVAGGRGAHIGIDRGSMQMRINLYTTFVLMTQDSRTSES